MFRFLLIRPTPSLYSRLCSSYVKHTRYLFELKENDDVCRNALKLGSFYLFHNFSPFLRKSGSSYSAPAISASEVQKILNDYGKDERMIEDSVLIGCSDSCVAEFALDLGSLERSCLEKGLSGTFTDLRKALLQLRGNDAPLLSRAQALLRWHETHQYCSKTGKPTHKNVSGSKRVCSANGMIYYPQMSPVVITLVSYKNRCLLARQETFPAGMYTALSGFCDIGETLEETVRREVAEEVGLEVESLRYSGSQHWPFPNSSLMVACQATVQQEEINLNTQELESARWFSLEEVEEALRRPYVPYKQEDGTMPVWVPPKWAIAHHLIQEWVEEQKTLLNGR
ncbi:NAD(P)H pyrophosphatase NUDT13, mitochondrial [Rhinophrynus dorsalis]